MGRRTLAHAAIADLAWLPDLGRRHPDLVALSFYNVFGWPTGIRCLIGRREGLVPTRAEARA